MADILDSILDDNENLNAEKFNNSMFMANQSNPDQYAKVLSLAKKRDLNPDFVERNYQALAPLNEDYSGYHDLQSRSPKTTEWISTPENVKIAKDDIDNLSKLEFQVEDHTRWGDVFNLLAHGTVQMGANLSKLPALIFNDEGLFGGDTYKPSDYVPKTKEAYDNLYNNPLTKSLSAVAKPFEVTRDRENILLNMSKGNLWPLTYAIVEAAPNAFLTMMMPQLGLPTLGLSTAADKNAQLLSEGVTPEKSAMSAAAAGTFEVATEMMGGIGEAGKPFKELIQAGVAQFGKEGFKSQFLRGVKNVAKTGKEEFGEEYLNAWASNIIDWGLGISDKTPDQVSLEAIEGGLVAFGSGAGMSIVGHGLIKSSEYLNKDLKDQMKTGYAVSLWDNVKGLLDESKLNKRSTDKAIDFLDKTMQGTGVESTYIPVKDFEEYYQSKKIDPVDAASSLNIRAEYEAAKASETDIKTNSAKLMVESKKTDDFDGIKEIMRMSEDGLSAKEHKVQVESDKKEAEEIKKELTAQQQYAKEAKEIVSGVYKTLIEQGESPAVAKAQSIVYKSIGIVADRLGVSPKNLMDKYGLKISIEKPRGQFGEIPTELIRESVQLAKDDSGNYLYDTGVLTRMLNGMELGSKGFRFNGGSKPSTFPSWFKNQNEKSKDVKKVIQKKLSGQTLTETQQDILNKMYELAVDADGRGELYQSRNEKTSTPEFKAWFGDSKVVDEDGNPLVVYHGTNAKIEEFKFDFTNKGADQLGSGFYFTTDVEEASGYLKKGVGSPNIVSAYLSIKNPLSADKIGDISEKQVLQIIKRSPIMESASENFDENPTIAQKKAVKAYSAKNEKVLNKLFEIANDFFGDNISEFNEAVKDVLGYDGVVKEFEDIKHYVAFFPNQIKSTSNSGSFDPNNPNILKQQNQGSYNPSTNEIKLFQGKKDFSTLLHESAHFFLDKVLRDAATQNAGLKKDFDIILDWIGSKDGVISTENHEKFARGFEAYLMEGKSPSLAMKKAFNTFKTWMLKIYTSLKGLEHQAGFPIELTPEIRGVFDRMLATEDEINLANQALDFTPLLTDEKMMTGEYISTREDARLEAEAKLNSQLLKEMEKTRSTEYREKFNQIKANFKSEFSKRPIYNAISVLINGSTLEGQFVDNIKIDPSTLPSDFTGQLSKKYISQDGLDYHAVASVFGYDNADAFLKELMDTPDIETASREAAKEIMQIEYPELFKSPEIKEEAKAAIHNENRSKLLKWEYEYLFKHARGAFNETARRLISRMPIDQQVKAQAKKFVGTLKTSELKEYQFERAERQASREAAKAFTRGDFDTALKEKRREYLNHEIYKEVVAAKTAVKDFRTWSKRIFEKDQDLAKKRDIDIVYAARSILTQYKMTPEKFKNSADYLEKIKEYDEAQYNSLVDLINSASEGAAELQNIDYDKFSELNDTVRALWDMAKVSKNVIMEGKSIDAESVMNELSVQIDNISGPVEQKKYNSTSGKYDDFKNRGLDYLASRTRINQWSNAMDLGERGIFRKFFVEKLESAGANYRIQKVETVKKLRDIAVKYKDIFSSKPITLEMPSGDFIFKNKAELIKAVLNIGNPSNKYKLLVGYGWAKVNADGALDSSEFDAGIDKLIADATLTKADFDYAQEVWNVFKSLTPQAQKAHKYTQGFYFSEITAEKIKNALGEWDGGYIPATYDHTRSSSIAESAARKQLEASNPSLKFPTPNRGMTKKRVDKFAAPMDLDLTNLESDLDEVLKFIHFEPAVADIRRVAMNKNMMRKLNEFQHGAVNNIIIPNLNLASTQRTVFTDPNTPKVINAAASWLRSNSSMMAMAWNVTNAIQDNISAFLTSAVKIDRRYFASAMVNYVMNNEDSMEKINSEPFMKSINQEDINKLSEQINSIYNDDGYFTDFKNFSKRSGMWLQDFTGNYLKNITWLASYNQAVSKGKIDDDARKQANLDVKTTMHISLPETVSSSETGTPLGMLLNQFSGYFVNVANLNESEFKIAHRKMGLKKGLPRMMYVYGMSIMAVSVLSQVASNLMNGNGFDDDGDKDTDVYDFLSLFFLAPFKFYAASFPYLGPAVQGVMNKYNKKVYDDRMQLMPSLNTLDSAAGGLAPLKKLITGDDIKKKDVKDALSLLGLMTGIPTSTITRPIDFADKMSK